MKKVKISGTYRTFKGNSHEIVDYEGVTGVIPDCGDDAIMFMNIKSRYAEMWIKDDKRYSERLHSVREVYIDSVEDVVGTPSFVGKNIAELDFVELQDLALAKDLRTIPRFKHGGLRAAREKAYRDYSDRVLRNPIEDKNTLNLAEMPKIIVDPDVKPVERKTLTNEEFIASEQKTDIGGKSVLSLDELKAMANHKGITYAPSIGFDTLYKRVFG